MAKASKTKRSSKAGGKKKAGDGHMMPGMPPKKMPMKGY